MAMRGWLAAFGLLLWLVSSALAAEKPVRVLFVGNSFTAINDLPKLTAQLAASARPRRLMETEFAGEGGATLQRHWEGDRALREIRRGGWDYVVLQDQGALGHYDDGTAAPRIADPVLFHEFARRFDEEIRKAGAKTVLLMTWARLDAPQTQAALTRAYLDAGHALNALVAPAGVAWQLALAERPGIPLHHADRSHPAAAGSYLAACVLYATLFSSSPEGLASAGLAEADTAFMQRTAWRAVHERAPQAAQISAETRLADDASPAASDTRGLAVFAAVQKSVGGVERLRALRDYSLDVATRVHTPMGEMTLQTREIFVFPAVVRTEMRTPGGDVVTFFDGSNGWRQSPQGIQDLPDRIKRVTRGQGIRNTLNLLRGEGEMTVRHEKAETIAGVAADVIVVSKGGETVRLVADGATGVLLGKRYRGVGTGGGADIEERYSDYREVSGIRMPFRVQVTQNGSPFMRGELVNVRFDSGVSAVDLGRKPEQAAPPGGG